jgi:hypothetical protein
MKQPQPLPRADLLDLKSILLRAAQEAERSNRTEHARRLAEELANIEIELAVTR